MNGGRSAAAVATVSAWLSLPSFLLPARLCFGAGLLARSIETVGAILDPTVHNFSKALVFVSSSLVSRHVCLDALSMADGDLPLKRSRLGRK